MDWGFRAWTEDPIAKKGRVLGTARVQLGDARSVGLVAPRDLAVAVPAGSDPTLKLKIVYNGPLKAPIKAGNHVADLIVTTGDTPPETMPLVAGADVGPAGVFDRVSAGLRSMFGDS